MSDFPPPRLEFGVRFARHGLVMAAGSLNNATVKVEQLTLETGHRGSEGPLVMVREHFTGEWMPWEYYQRYAQAKDDDPEGHGMRRLRLFYMEQVHSLRNEVWRLRLQLNTEWENIPLKPLKELPSEWRTMLSLTVEDVARELETIINRELEKKTIPRALPEAAVDDSHPVPREVRIKVGRRRHTFRTAEAAAEHLAMAKLAVAEFERRELEQ